MVQAPLLTSCNPPNANFLGEPEIPMRQWLNQLANRIIAGDRIKPEEALALIQIEGQENIVLLCEAADKVRGIYSRRVSLSSGIGKKSFLSI